MSVDQIAFKTNAWKSAGMVAGYANNVADASGANLMKNRVETELFQKYVRGNKVLDVGIGTGRASIPLAKLGHDVTGVDSSEAMLRKCRELAAGSPMTLVVGDVVSLPVQDAAFDTVMALNTIAHFPHWQQILKEWSRAARPGGRIIFDMFSMDHDTGYATAVGQPPQWGIEHFAPPSVESYYLRLPVEDLVRGLDDLGLSVETIVPYSVFCGTKGYNHFFDGTLLSGFAWDRLLSWVAADRDLFDFFLLLEQELVANLTSIAACRYMTVLTKAPDLQKNKTWIKRNAGYNAALAKGFSLCTMESFSGIDAGAFKKRLNELMEHAPNRFALARILLTNLKWRWPANLAELLDRPYRAEIEAILERGRLDADVVDLLQGLHQAPATSADFTYSGVNLGPSIEYNSMIAVLDKAYAAFDEPFSGPMRRLV